ncbi:phage protein [Escherichia coli]|nr:phage protein [Escherichia coli]
MNKQYKLVVKGINNYPDKITVTVALEIGGYPSLLLPNVAISLDRTEGATLEFYEAEAKKQAKQFFMDIAAALCEGDEQSPEKAPHNFRGAGCVDNLQRKTTGNNYWFSEDATDGIAVRKR